MIIFIILVLLFIFCAVVYVAQDDAKVVVFFVLLIFGAYSTVLGFNIITNLYTNPCEKSLPRDQKCIIIAVPENSEAAKLYKTK